ncbi:MAG TPA: hypothetical protein VE282_05865 [Gemmatimonadales bacterium]|nr:hypothetical protein [Gemmatimonadales bacterium]
MLYRALCAGAITLSACGQALSSPVSTRTAAGPEDTYACVRKQLAELGYKQTSYDATELRVAATKLDTKSRRPDVQFRRIHNKLDVRVAAEADGNTSIEVLPRTFAEYTTQRGPTEEQEKASELVKSDAQQLVERCRS